jgi:hypothetical protein
MGAFHYIQIVRKDVTFMIYPFMTLNNGTEITHSEMKPDGKVKVYIETPDERYCFKHATCWNLSRL